MALAWTSPAPWPSGRSRLTGKDGLLLHPVLSTRAGKGLERRSKKGSCSAIQGAAALVLAAEREGGLALGLGHLAGQVDERLQEGAAVSH